MTSPRPRAISALAWLFIAVGGIGLLMDLWPLVTPDAAQQLAKLKADGIADLGPAWASRLLAVIGGGALLRGVNWARWLLVVWMAFHIWLSALHSVTLLLMHAAIFAVVGYLMFRPASTAFFRAQTAGAAR